VGFVGGPIPKLPANLSLLKGAGLIGVDVRQYQLMEPEAAARDLADLLRWVAQGQLLPAVGRRFKLGEFAQALQFALSGSGLGKTVVEIDP
jgi:NADPH2:quinone reductase